MFRLRWHRDSARTGRGAGPRRVDPGTGSVQPWGAPSGPARLGPWCPVEHRGSRPALSSSGEPLAALSSPRTCCRSAAGGPRPRSGCGGRVSTGRSSAARLASALGMSPPCSPAASGRAPGCPEEKLAGGGAAAHRQAALWTAGSPPVPVVSFLRLTHTRKNCFPVAEKMFSDFQSVTLE